MSIAAIRAGFRAFFGDNGPELPDPMPPSGSMSGGGWAVRYVLRDVGGKAVLDFLADQAFTPPLHGRVADDGSTQTVGMFLDHYVFDPTLDESEDAARARMEEHNREIARELERVGLI